MFTLKDAPSGSVYVETGGYGLLPLCKHKMEGKAVPSHADPHEPEFGATAEEVRRYVEEMREHHDFLDPIAYFWTPEEYWRGKQNEAGYELFKLSLPRGAQETYYSFTGHFLAPTKTDGLRLLGRVARRDQAMEATLVASTPDGVNIKLQSTNEVGIVYLEVWCPAGGWNHEGYVYNAAREDSSACCGVNPHGGAWRYYLPEGESLRKAGEMALAYFRKQSGHPTASQCRKALAAALAVPDEEVVV